MAQKNDGKQNKDPKKNKEQGFHLDEKAQGIPKNQPLSESNPSNAII